MYLPLNYHIIKYESNSSKSYMYFWLNISQKNLAYCIRAEQVFNSLYKTEQTLNVCISETHINLFTFV